MHAPSPALPSQFSDAGAGGGARRARMVAQLSRCELDQLEGDVDAANPNLAAALAQLPGRQGADAEAASLGCFRRWIRRLGLSANKQSANRPLRSASQPTYYGANQVDAGVAAYEVDIWGRVADSSRRPKPTPRRPATPCRRAARAACGTRARLRRSERHRRQAKLLADTIEVYRSALNLTRERLDAKIAPPIDEQRARPSSKPPGAGVRSRACGARARLTPSRHWPASPRPDSSLRPTPAPHSLSAPPARRAGRRAAPAPRRRRRPSATRSPQANSSASAAANSIPNSPSVDRRHAGHRPRPVDPAQHASTPRAFDVRFRYSTSGCARRR